MNKKTLTKALAINVVVLVLVVALLGGLTFAWFSTRQTADTTQVVQVGNFAINLNDTVKEYTSSQSINFTKAFPSTDAVANADDTVAADTGKKENIDYIKGNKFLFSVKNAGDIDALFGLKIAINEANDANLTSAMRFNVYKQDAEGSVTYSKIKYVKSNNTALSTVSDVEKELVKAAGIVKVPTSSSEATAVDSGLAGLKVAAEVQLCVVAWIDKDTAYGAADAAVTAGDSFEFAVQMAAIQAVGGITKADIDAAKIFDNMPPQEWTTAYEYSENVDMSSAYTKEFAYKYTMNGIGVAPYLDKAKTGAYGNKIVINFTNTSASAKKLTWTVEGKTDNAITDNLIANIDGTEYTGLTNIAGALSKIDISASTTKTITIYLYSTTEGEQAKLINVSFKAVNTVEA